MSPFRARITLPKPLWYSTGLILLFNGLLFAWLLININNQALLASVDYWAQTLGPLLMLPFGFLALWNAWRKKSGARAVTGIIYPSSSLMSIISSGSMIPTAIALAMPYCKSWDGACATACEGEILLGAMAEKSS